jgi:hypothetical protein
MTSGGPTAISGAMSSVPQTSIPDLKVLNSAFAAQQAAVNPAATNIGETVNVYAEKDFTTYGLYGQFATLLTLTTNVTTPDGGTITSDIDYGPVSYGNPFPASWEPFLDVIYGFDVPYDLPGDSAPAIIESVSGFYEPVAGLDWASAITPPLPPMTNPQINGQSLFTDQKSVGLTPTISWTAPAGPVTPNTYLVTIYDLSLDSSGNVQLGSPFSEYPQDATFTITGTSLTLPKGLLVAETSTAAHWYFAAIDAQYTKNGSTVVDQTATPYLGGTLYDDVEILTNKFTPGPGAAPPPAYGTFLVHGDALPRRAGVYRKPGLLAPRTSIVQRQ